MIKIVAVGDIMPGGVLNGLSREYVSQEIKDIFSKGDIRVGTLETAVGNEPNFNIEKMNRYGDVIYVEDEDIKRLIDLNINVVSLANNHFFDLGQEGAEHTIALLDKLGIKHCGGGRNIQEASAPAVVTIKGKTIAFIGFCDWHPGTTGWCPFATESESGVAPMYDDYVVEVIKKYRKQFDYIVVIPHWGKEYMYRPTVEVYRTNQKLLKAGADLILGGHTHCVQPIINKNGKSTIYSMGNFFFPDRLICPPRSTYYPHPLIDINKLPVTDRWPIVEEVTLKLWRPMARVGMIVISTLDKKGINSKSFYTKLSKDNFITIQSLEPKLKKKLRIIQFMLNSGLYVEFSFFIRCIHFLRSLPSRFLSKMAKIFNL